jgi:hypothetical protein
MVPVANCHFPTSQTSAVGGQTLFELSIGQCRKEWSLLFLELRVSVFAFSARLSHPPESGTVDIPADYVYLFFLTTEIMFFPSLCNSLDENVQIIPKYNYTYKNY